MVDSGFFPVHKQVYFKGCSRSILWDKADVIKVSDVELEFLTGSDKIDDASALSLWHPNLKLLLVTLGENGSRYYTKVKTIASINF